MTLAPTHRKEIPFWIGAAVAGLVLRLALVLISPRYGYMGDHDDFVRWGLQAANEGVTTLYDHPPPRRPVRVWSASAQQWVLGERSIDRLCNYPPISIYLLAISGHVFKAVSPDQVVNTPTSRLVFEIWPVVADFLVAWGVASIVTLLQRRDRAKWAFLLILLLPPLCWDSAVWGQMDSLFLAPAVWMVRMLIAGQWGWAGILFGLAAGLKPQALLLIPVWAMAAILTRNFARTALGLAAAATTLVLATLPFLIHNGLAWFRASYAENVGAYASQTTLNAFNIWYADVLLTSSDDAMRRWLGLTKHAWGMAFLAIGLASAFLWLARRWRGRAAGLVPWTALSLLICVMLPTQVHERYLLLSLPFLAAAAFAWPRIWPGLLLLTIACTAQVTWPLWIAAEARDPAALSRDLRKQYDEQLARMPADERDQAIPFEEMNTEMFRHYAVDRAKTVPVEWLFVIISLAGAATTTYAITTARPSSQTATQP